MEGVQHNTYDVEFYGPNPQCGVYYLGALRAAKRWRARWATLRRRRSITGSSRAAVAGLMPTSSTANTTCKELSAIARQDCAGTARRHGIGRYGASPIPGGDGCLVDQLVGQYLADVAGLGMLVSREHGKDTGIHLSTTTTTDALEHDNVQRTFALNDEAAMVICDYAEGKRPQIPFPYYAEVMTGFEHARPR